MYQYILFDLDGTLLDTSRGVEMAVIMTIEQLGYKMLNDKTIKKFVGPPMQDSFMRYYGVDFQTALNASNLFRENYRKNTLLEAEVYPGILKLLEHLRKNGKKIAVATNKSHDNAYAILEHFGIVPLCDFVLGSDMGGKLSKADIIGKCIEQLCADVNKTVLIGDSDYDSIGAEKVGIDFIAVTYGFGFKKDEINQNSKYKYVCENVNELEHILEV